MITSKDIDTILDICSRRALIMGSVCSKEGYNDSMILYINHFNENDIKWIEEQLKSRGYSVTITNNRKRKGVDACRARGDILETITVVKEGRQIIC